MKKSLHCAESFHIHVVMARHFSAIFLWAAHRMVCFVPVFFLAGCGLFGGEEEDNARINPRGIDGVEFGDTQEEVLEKLGPFDSWGITDGFGRNWYHFTYLDGPSAGLKLRFIEILGIDEDGDSALVAGPVDMLSVEAPYSGTTRKGIYVGVTESDVRRAYGTPIESRRYSRFYCLGGRDMELIVVEDTVRIIALGYFEPFAGSQRCLD